MNEENRGVSKLWEFGIDEHVEGVIEAGETIDCVLKPLLPLRIISVNVASSTVEEHHSQILSSVKVLYVTVGDRVCAAFSERHPVCNPPNAIKVTVRNFAKVKASFIVQLFGYEQGVN
jgi:hypothetical protein